MHIQVQNEHSLHQAFLQEDSRGDGHVVDDAEARAGVWESMVRAPGGVAGQLVPQRQSRCQQSACRRAGKASGCETTAQKGLSPPGLAGVWGYPAHAASGLAAPAALSAECLCGGYKEPVGTL
jgi:hypothetical protein